MAFKVCCYIAAVRRRIRQRIELTRRRDHLGERVNVSTGSIAMAISRKAMQNKTGELMTRRDTIQMSWQRQELSEMGMTISKRSKCKEEGLHRGTVMHGETGQEKRQPSKQGKAE